jgi:hypothetical protein
MDIDNSWLCINAYSKTTSVLKKNELFLSSGYRLTADYELFISTDGKQFN